MKQLLLGVVLLILLGVGGFLYRNMMETAPPDEVACTMEAKLCPDGSAVGRQGPLCEFSPCPLPNAEDQGIGLAFVIPPGYVSNPDPIGMDETLRVVLDNNDAPGGIPHSIIIRRYAIPAGQTAEDVILANTFHETSGMQVESMDEFKPIIIGGRTYESITVERFEAIVHTHFYLQRDTDVLRFEVLERDVMEWMEPSLVVTELPEHQALIGLLGSVQSR